MVDCCTCAGLAACADIVSHMLIRIRCSPRRCRNCVEESGVRVCFCCLPYSFKLPLAEQVCLRVCMTADAEVSCDSTAWLDARGSHFKHWSHVVFMQASSRLSAWPGVCTTSSDTNTVAHNANSKYIEMPQCQVLCCLP